MTISKFAIVAIVLGATAAPAFADSGEVDDRLAVFLASRNTAAVQAAAPVQEGRQAVRVAQPTAAPATAPLTDADRYVIERNVENN